MAYPLHISTAEIDRHAKALLNPIKYGENSVVMCYPGCFIGYTVHAFMDSPRILKTHLGPFYRKYFLIPIECASNDTAASILKRTSSFMTAEIGENAATTDLTVMQLSRMLVNRGLEPYFYLINMHLVKHPVRTAITETFHEIVTEIPRSGLLWCTEANIYDDEHTRLFNTYHRLNHIRSVIPVFSTNESRVFVSTLGKTWGLTLSPTIISTIVTLSGGYLWLLREAVRAIRDGCDPTPECLTRRSKITDRAEYVVALLDERIVDGLYELLQNPYAIVPRDVVKYIETTGLCNKTNEGYSLTCPLFWTCIEKRKMRMAMSVRGLEILYKGQEVGQKFSPSERKILRILLQHRGTTVTRDTIARALWEERAQDGYSDWAIDKTVSRIRRKLTTIGMPHTSVTTKKRRGFILS